MGTGAGCAPGGAAPCGALRAPVLLAFAIAAVLRLVPLGHGLPGLHVPDSHSVRNALGMLQTRNPVPRSNEFSSYPYLYSYLCLPLFAADYAAARVTGRARSAQEYQEWAAGHLERFHLLARVLAALAGAGAAAAAALAAGRLAGREAAFAAGLLAATGPFPVLLSTHERPWALVLLFATVSLACALRALAEPARTRPLLLSALAAGAAVASHQTGAAAFAIPCAAAWLRAPGFDAGALRAKALGGAIALGGFLALFFVGNPYYLVYGPGGGIPSSVTDATAVSIGGQGLAFKFNAAHTPEALRGLLGLEGVVALLSIAGAAILARRRDRRLLLLLAYAAPIVLFFSAYVGTHARYFLLAFPALWVLAGVALASLASRGVAGFLVALVLVAIPTILTFRLDQLLLRDDTRGLVAPHIDLLVPEGAVLAVEPYGPALQPSVPSLERLATREKELGIPILTRRERLAFDRRAPGGHDLLPLERVVADPAPHLPGDPDPAGYARLTPLAAKLYPGARDLPSLFAAANVEFVLRVDRFPGAGRDDPLARLLAERGEPVWGVCPQGNEEDPDPPEALLPFEPRLGAISLFAVERPGPRIELYRLKR